MKTSAWRITRDLTIDFTFYTILFLSMYSIDMFVVMDKDQITMTEAFGMHFFLLFWGWQVWLSMLLFWVGGGLLASMLHKTPNSEIYQKMRSATLPIYYVVLGIMLLFLSFYYRLSDLAQRPVATVSGLFILGIILSLRSYFRQKKDQEA